MLLYDNNSNRDIASINYINQGLEQKLLCIYASVNAYNTSHLTKISSQIKDYEENVRKRNLLIVNLKPFYDSALAKDLTPFEEFKMQNAKCSYKNLKIEMVKAYLLLLIVLITSFGINTLTNVIW
jgi:hypothetical protein